MEKERGDRWHWVSESEFDGGFEYKTMARLLLGLKEISQEWNGVMKTSAIEVAQLDAVLKAEWAFECNWREPCMPRLDKSTDSVERLVTENAAQMMDQQPPLLSYFEWTTDKDRIWFSLSSAGLRAAPKKVLCAPHPWPATRVSDLKLQPQSWSMLIATKKLVERRGVRSTGSSYCASLALCPHLLLWVVTARLAVQFGPDF